MNNVNIEYIDIDYPAVCDECDTICEGNAVEVEAIGTYCAYNDNGKLYGCYYEVGYAEVIDDTPK
jgi:hypothetical protein